MNGEWYQRRDTRRLVSAYVWALFDICRFSWTMLIQNRRWIEAPTPTNKGILMQRVAIADAVKIIHIFTEYPASLAHDQRIHDYSVALLVPK